MGILTLVIAVVSLLWTVTPCDATTGFPMRTLLPNSLLPSEEAPVSQFSPVVGVRSPPGAPVIKLMYHQDLNKRILIALIVASSLLTGVLCFLVCFWIIRCKRLKAFSKSSSQNSDAARGPVFNPRIGKGSSSGICVKQGSLAVFEYQLLEAATNRFAEGNIMGEGVYGLVYKARFSEKFIAAVKKLDIVVGLDSQRGYENEVNWLSRIRHPNIITLLCYCVHGESRCLVYEIMLNGSLEEHLHGRNLLTAFTRPSQGSALTRPLRIKIAVDVAKGLEFLHEHCSSPVVHRDLKASNILLDTDFNAKLCNFGLAVTAGTQNKDKIKLADSAGKLTDKSNVYAFGVILLELLMGRKPVEETAAAQRQSLVTWAVSQLTDRANLPNILDPAIKGTMDLKHLYQVAAVAVLCIQPEPSYRPLITDVLHSLIPLLPFKPGGSLRVSEALSAEALETCPESLNK